MLHTISSGQFGPLYLYNVILGLEIATCLPCERKKGALEVLTCEMQGVVDDKHGAGSGVEDEEDVFTKPGKGPIVP